MALLEEVGKLRIIIRLVWNGVPLNENVDPHWLFGNWGGKLEQVPNFGFTQSRAPSMPGKTFIGSNRVPLQDCHYRLNVVRALQL